LFVLRDPRIALRWSGASASAPQHETFVVASSNVRTFQRAVLLVASLFAGFAFAQTQFKGDAAKGAAKAQPCLACHGAKGQPPAPGTPSLNGQPPEYLVLQMFLFREGLRDVPPMRGVLNGFKDPELNDVAAYFSALQPVTKKSKPDAKLRARGGELASGMGCGSCHMAEFTGQREVPRLAGQAEDYLVASMQAYRDNKRVGTDTNMNGIMARMNDADIRALAHFFAQR
jgi:cytochrome c553